MEFARLKALYNLCNPDEPLAPNDARYVDLDKQGVRGPSWTNKLARRIELSQTPVCQLASGQLGAGKSTELRRLAARLSDRDGTNLLPVLIDGEEAIDLNVEIDVSDLLTAALSYAERAVVALEGGDPGAVRREGPAQRLWSWLTSTDVEIREISGSKVALDLRTNPSLRTQVRRRVASHMTTFVGFVHDELRELEFRAKKAGRAGLVILFDSLEKLRGTSKSWREVLRSAEQIFAGGAPLLRLPVHAVFTIPPALTRGMIDPIPFLPMIRVRDRTGFPDRDGVEAVFRLVWWRVDGAALEEMFGQGAVNDRIQTIALWSGGCPRDVMRLLQTLLASEVFPLSARDVEKELTRYGYAYRQIAYGRGAIPWLGQVHREKQGIASSEEERELDEYLLANNVILRYFNGDVWEDVHPALVNVLTPGEIP